MNKKKALVVTHGSDADGIISAAMMYKFLSPRYKVEFVFIIHSTKKDVFKAISMRKDLDELEVWIIDLALNKYLIVAELNNESIMQRIARVARNVVYIDHHDGMQTHKQLLKSLGVSVLEGYLEKICTAKLIYNTYFYLSGEKYLDWLSIVAQHSDYPDGLKDEIAQIGENLNKIIFLYLSESNIDAVKGLTVTLSGGKYWYIDGQYSGEIKEALVRFEIIQREALTVLGQSIEVVEIDNKKIIIGFGDGILPDKDTIAEVMRRDDEKADSYIIAFGSPLNNALVLRGAKSSFPVMDFCKFMAGGGRPYGEEWEIGGFSFSFILDDSNYKKAKEIIIKGLKDFLKK